MREILFRGKATNRDPFYTYRTKYKNGDWVYGLLTDCENYAGFAQMTNTDGVSGIDVDKTTVGQYTGLTDKNGKKIFEGDIVVVYARGYHTVCTVSWAETVAHFQLWQINTIPKTSTNLNLGNYDCEVIGNIHDNPELLKEGVQG